MMGIPKTMKALVAYSKTDYRLETNYPVPECGDDDIIIKTEGCGICAGDLKCKHGAAMFWGDEIQPSWVEPPFIPGHEFLGRIVEIGKNVKNFKIGDRVIPEQIVPCGECRFCKDGHYWMCQPHRILGFFNSCNGGMAEYVKLSKNTIVHKIPDKTPLEAALLIEPFACSKHCVDRAEIKAEDILVISGAGTLGLGMVTYARSRNPKKIITLDLVDDRLNKAKELGSDLVWNPKKTDVIAEIMKLTDGYGCDIYIEATGAPASVVQGMKMIRKLGRFIEFSVFAEQTSLDWSIIGDRKELDVRGSHLSPYCYPYVIENITNGKLKTDGIVSSVFKLEDWESAFEYAGGKHGDYKVAFKF
ncbi:alcohol dehydrogenase catalytic domain-containing protein [Treponema parvum]|uniref:Alcohol dehydrogenase catalytic domain-containing protein n=2 Tax=Treponema parvum TaxID=138851 RepID=A0A975F6G1_9SPIR|nr:alcohol dehydrogenase catalytic domain-containing protein [Treponema parvum]